MFDVQSRRNGAIRNALLVLLVICATAGAAAADSEDATRGLAERARQHFEVLPLREGVLLKPHAGGAAPATR